MSQKKKTELTLFDRTNTPNPSREDKEALQKRLKECPQLWREVADLAKRIENDIFQSVSSSSYLARESYRMKLDTMRVSLGWGNCSELERILIEQVCLSWLRLNLLELLHFEKTTASHTTETGLYWDKRLSAAQRRYMRACEALARVRKLLAEAELKEQQARHKRGQSALIAQRIVKDAEE